ncbi:nucleotide sugar dehydrogenase [Algoriphagus sp. D3-2-R+10]|uniref:UDP-glucose dehydrogenase family protein n=1 Tax=Algoriphagus aurantiacus TaxID=3103948 RepID=UPI002B37410C|nr:nucleotide sugar dehydrogenase [Algoriphagus sp. D3-2-R+10]MEB2777654.1 nucleotide sugar dehydrogenase [Algoriphagus sp. D3-2-R+10]
MNITVLGLGFVGLTTSLGLAKKGFKTYGFDINESRLASLKKHHVPFFEPHLKDILIETLGSSFLLDVPFEDAIKNSDAIFLCVGTPEKANGSADLTYLLNGIEQILNVPTEKFQVLITKSTVPPSTLSKEVIPFVNQKLAENPSRKVGFASNPEFLREGYCWEDFISPDRVVIGVEDEQSKEILDKVYQPFGAPIHYVNYNTAEFIKYLSNTMLSTMISYANEMSMIAGAIGDIEIKKAFQILHEDKRWFGNPAGIRSYVYPGCGYGGYCLPKDTAALVSVAEKNGYSPAMLKANLHVNKEIKPFLVEQIIAEVSPNTNLGILGLSFKPNSDDVRITPPKEIIKQLLEKGYSNIFAYDPISNEEFKNHYPDLPITYLATLDQLYDKVDCMVLLTGWNEFKEKKEQLQKKKVFDFRYTL